MTKKMILFTAIFTLGIYDGIFGAYSAPGLPQTYAPPGGATGAPACAAQCRCPVNYLLIECHTEVIAGQWQYVGTCKHKASSLWTPATCD